MYQIDNIIKILNSSSKSEFSEQEANTSDSGGSSESPEYPTVTKWESGVTRGPANQIGLTKWKDIVTINRGKANTLL